MRKIALVFLTAFALSGCAPDPAAGTGCTGGEIAGGGAVLAVFVAVVWLVWQRQRIGKLAIAFALLAGAAHAQHAGPLYALAGDVLVMPPAPVADPGRVVAQAAQATSHAELPSVSVTSQVQVPPVALNPLAPLVPPACTPPTSQAPRWYVIASTVVTGVLATLATIEPFVVRP